jgi:hypothetical protein
MGDGLLGRPQHASPARRQRAPNVEAELHVLASALIRMASFASPSGRGTSAGRCVRSSPSRRHVGAAVVPQRQSRTIDLWAWKDPDLQRVNRDLALKTAVQDLHDAVAQVRRGPRGRRQPDNGTADEKESG